MVEQLIKLWKVECIKKTNYKKNSSNFFEGGACSTAVYKADKKPEMACTKNDDCKMFGG